MTQIGTSREEKGRRKGFVMQTMLKSVDVIVQEKRCPKPGNVLCFVPGIQMFCQISPWGEHTRIGDSSSIWDGISGARHKAGTRQGWLGHVRSVYHEPKAVAQWRVDMEARFNRPLGVHQTPFPFLAGKRAKLRFPASLAVKIGSCDSVLANWLWMR